jgi:parvulin-like peptidyl-prolyl isomerase
MGLGIRRGIMNQEIIIRKENYIHSNEEEDINKLKVEYLRTKFSTYERSREYLHIQIGEFDEFNFYLELNEYQMEDLIKQLQEQVKKVRYNY